MQVEAEEFPWDRIVGREFVECHGRKSPFQEALAYSGEEVNRHDLCRYRHRPKRVDDKQRALIQPWHIAGFSKARQPWHIADRQQKAKSNKGRFYAGQQ